MVDNLVVSSVAYLDSKVVEQTVECWVEMSDNEWDAHLVDCWEYCMAVDWVE